MRSQSMSAPIRIFIGFRVHPWRDAGCSRATATQLRALTWSATQIIERYGGPVKTACATPTVQPRRLRASNCPQPAADIRHGPRLPVGGAPLSPGRPAVAPRGGQHLTARAPPPAETRTPSWAGHTPPPRAGPSAPRSRSGATAVQGWGSWGSLPLPRGARADLQDHEPDGGSQGGPGRDAGQLVKSVAGSVA
jgi:hypothetical protein